MRQHSRDALGIIHRSPLREVRAMQQVDVLLCGDGGVEFIADGTHETLGAWLPLARAPTWV